MDANGGHETGRHETAGHMTGPTGPGSVILELGGDVGALILETPPDLAGREIEISTRANPARTHSLVRQRRGRDGTSHAAVYPGLPAADYIIWRDDGTPAGTVTIRGGAVARFRWPEVAPDSEAPRPRSA